MKKHPIRLTNAQFIDPSSSFQIYYQHISNEHHSLHWHEFYELCFVLRGRGVNIVNGTEHQLTRGSLFLLTPADFHEIYSFTDEPMDIYNLVFSGEFLGEDIRELMFQQFAEYMVDIDANFDMIESEFRLISSEAYNWMPGQRLMVKGSLERILLHLFRAHSQKHPRIDEKDLEAQHRSIQRALVYIHHHFRDPLRLEEAAKQAALAPNYFSQAFRKMTGIPFQIYLQGLRLNFAKSLLMASDIPVTEICYASGFNTLTHFERAFKLKFGSSPRTFQK